MGWGLDLMEIARKAGTSLSCNTYTLKTAHLAREDSSEPSFASDLPTVAGAGLHLRLKGP